jgi:chemotaxis response regulator CheB
MQNAPKSPTTPRVVVLCGSSGSLSPLVEILSAVPWDSDNIFVVPVHRRGGTSGLLVYLLERAAQLRVKEIEDGDPLLAGYIHVMPPAQDLTTDGDVFALAPMSKTFGGPDVFDIFLRSLAGHARHRTVTVILSGLGQDGSASLDSLRLSGSLIVAQSDAKSPGMPDAAIATGHVDYIGTAADIGSLVVSLRP